MDNPPSRNQITEPLDSLAVLFVMLIYTYGILIAAPYSGFYFNSITGQVVAVFVQMGDHPLQPGDVITRLDDIPWSEIKDDRRLVLFNDFRAGDPLNIRAKRNDNPIEIQWTFPGFNKPEFFNRLFNSWMVGYVFWLAGFAVQVSIRPRNARRRLFITANYLTALFLVSGTLSSWHLWESSTLLHMSTWLMVPVFLQLHWEFPRPLGKISKPFWNLLYAIATLLAAGEAIHMLPRNLYAFGFLVAFIGSLVLLSIHLLAHKDERPAAGFLLLSIFIAFSSSLAAAIAVTFGATLNIGWFTVFSMPFMPLAYFYLIYRRQLGGMETRINRLISTYAFLILLGLVIFAAVLFIFQTKPPLESWAILAACLPILAVILTATYLTRFQAYINQHLFGIKLPYQNLPETFSSRIAASDNLPSLLALLRDEVFPSLLVRQYAFLQSQDKALSALLVKDISDAVFDFDVLSQKAGSYIPNLPPNADWIRLVLPLKVGDITLGFWLLGKRDPDDLYPQVEIPILQSLADQTAIALSNILQSDRLREYYRSELEIVGSERRRIARDLHESVLNKLANLRNSLDQKTLPPSFLSSYDDLKKRLREIIRNMRPPMLDQGLAFAISDTVEDFREKYEGVNIVLDLSAGEERLPEKVEEYLYYIVHEACQNALKHSNCRTLTISGVISTERVDLSIQDDGDGFDVQDRLNSAITNRHFGLAHMKERAHLIEADANIDSKSGKGTIIRVSWRVKEK